MLRSAHRERYASVEAVEVDLRNYFDGRPIEAQRGSVRYVFGKFVRRHAVYLAAAAVVMLALVGGLIGTSVSLRKANNLADENRDLLYQAGTVERSSSACGWTTRLRASNSQSTHPRSRLGRSERIRVVPSMEDVHRAWRITLVARCRRGDPGTGGSPLSLVCTSAGKQPRVTLSDLSFHSGVPMRSTFIDFSHTAGLQHHVYWDVVPTIACAPEAGLFAYFQFNQIELTQTTTLILADFRTGEVLDTLDGAPYLSSEGSVRPVPSVSRLTRPCWHRDTRTVPSYFGASPLSGPEFQHKD